jgi:hypothetical protein
MALRLFKSAINVPAREVADYSEDECLCFRDAFSSIAAKYRFHARISYVGVGGGFVTFFLTTLLPKTAIPWPFISFIICWLVALGGALTAPPLICPGCCNDIEHSFGKYCPECGSASLEPSTFFHRSRCLTCRKSMGGGKGRHYKIRACTHCGLMLDQRGL